MPEPDDVEDAQRLASIVRELLAEHPVGECEMKRFYGPDLHPSLVCGSPTAIVEPCQPCRARALRERLNRIARGEA